MVLVFCALALVVALTRSRTLGIFLLVVELLVIVAMRRLGLRAEVLRLAMRKRDEVRSEYFGDGDGEEASAG